MAEETAGFAFCGEDCEEQIKLILPVVSLHGKRSMSHQTYA